MRMRATTGSEMRSDLLVAVLAALLACVCMALCPSQAHAVEGSSLIGASELSTQATKPGHYTDAKTESESNDSFASADSISLNKYVYGTYSKSDDYDFFKVTAPKTGVYTLSLATDTVGASGRWRVRVYDRDRGEVLNDYKGVELFRYDWTVQLPVGIAYIEIYNEWDLSLGTEYHLRLASSSYKAADSASFSGFRSISGNEREDNGTMETANMLKLGSYAYGNYSSSDDHDFYVLKIPTAGVYTLSFATDTVNASGRWRIRVYDFDRGEALDDYKSVDLSRYDWTVQLPAGAAYIEVCDEWDLNLSTAYHVRLKGDLAASARVTGVTSKTYTGKAQTQSKLAVKIGSKTLKRGTDYTVAYKNNTKAGTATITIKGKGAYQGTVTKTFRIAKVKASKFVVSKIANQKYKKGKAVKPTPTVKFTGKKLKKGKDYTLSYSNNKKRGTAKVTIVGKGNFTGKKVVQFKIR